MLKKKWSDARREAGDTIVEVLICVSIISLILVTTFGLANRSSVAVQKANERNEATKIAQSQLEKLKYYLTSSSAAGNSVAYPPNDSFFCMKDSPTGPQWQALTITKIRIDDPQYYNSIDNSCKSGVNGRYNSMIYHSVDGTTYTTYIRWDSVDGKSVEKIGFVHRLYPDIASLRTVIPSGQADLFTVTPVTKRGASYDVNSCVVWPDPAYRCTRGTNPLDSVYSCQNYALNYTLIGPKLNGANRLTINYADSLYCSGAPTPPVGWYKYNLAISINGGVATNVQVDPPAGSFSISIPPVTGNRVDVRIEWNNNQWVPSDAEPWYDPDFQINSITVGP